MVALMNIDVMPVRLLIVCTTLSVALLVGVFIGGAAGPSAMENIYFAAYNCNTTRTCASANQSCPGGVHLSDEGAVWNINLTGLEVYNEEWSMIAYPFVDTPAFVDYEILIDVFVYEEHNNTMKLIQNATISANLFCPETGCACYRIPLVLVSLIQSPNYSVSISLPPSLGKYFVGDMVFELSTLNTQFSKLELGFRTTYLGITIIITMAWLLRLIYSDLPEWTFEQRGTTLLLLALIGANNPFFSLRYVSNVWLLIVIDSFLEIGFLCILILWWLMIIDYMRRSDLRLNFKLEQIFKYIAVVILFSLSVSLAIWVGVLQSSSVLITGENVVGMSVLFYLASAIFGCIVTWLIIMTFIAMPVIYQQHHSVIRFMFIAIPSLVCIISILVGMFAGTYGPFNRSLLSFMYFFGLYNVYVWYLCVGYWPIKSEFAIPNPETETSGLIGFENHNPEHDPLAPSGKSEVPVV